MLSRAAEYIETHKLNVYALAEYDGSNIAVRRLQPANELNNIYSLSKTVTATAIGMLCHRGLLRTDDLALPYLKKHFPKVRDPKWDEITIGNLLSHTWGQTKGDLFEHDRYTHGTDDWLGYVLGQTLPLQVGVDFRYSNASYYLLGAVAETVAGRPLADFVRTELGGPLGWQGFAASACPKGHTVAATGMFLRVADMAKLGALWLHNGEIDGRRYFGADWAKLASAPKACDGRRYYGYSVWRGAPDSLIYYGDGANGQMIAISPKSRSVLAMQAYDSFDMQALVDFIAQSDI